MLKAIKPVLQTGRSKWGRVKCVKSREVAGVDAERDEEEKEHPAQFQTGVGVALCSHVRPQLRHSVR